MHIPDRDQVGAFTRHTHAELSGANSGPLAGLTFGLKDIYDVAGHRTGFGSPDWLRTHDAATANARVLQALLDAGASMVGRTHTEEMAFSITGENAHYGTPLNVAAPGRVPGGSSSGSAAAVAARLVDFAIGSDTGGSVRAPASYCGLYGIRPTHGRITMTGACPLAPSFDTSGWFARDAELLARIGSVLFGNMPFGNVPFRSGLLGNERIDDAPRVPGRLLFATDCFALVMPEARDALVASAAYIEQQLGAAERVTVSAIGLSNWFDVFRTLQFAEIRAAHGAWITRERPTFGPAIAQRFVAVANADTTLVPRALEARRAISTHLDELLRDNAVLLMPSMPNIAPLLQMPVDETIAFRERAMGLLCIAGLGGLPQISLPFARIQGCPIGISLVAARGNDELLLAMARQLVPPLGATLTPLLSDR